MLIALGYEPHPLNLKRKTNLPNISSIYLKATGVYSVTWSISTERFVFLHMVPLALQEKSWLKSLTGKSLVPFFLSLLRTKTTEDVFFSFEIEQPQNCLCHTFSRSLFRCVSQWRFCLLIMNLEDCVGSLLSRKNHIKRIKIQQLIVLCLRKVCWVCLTSGASGSSWSLWTTWTWTTPQPGKASTLMKRQWGSFTPSSTWVRKSLTSPGMLWPSTAQTSQCSGRQNRESETWMMTYFLCVFAVTSINLAWKRSRG